MGQALEASGSSSFLKVLKSAGAIPGTAVENLKGELRSTATKIEDAAALKPLLEKAEEELRGFLMLDGGGRLVYRPTSLDTLAVLQSLIPHIRRPDNSLLPFARHGAGMISLQSFLIVLHLRSNAKLRVRISFLRLRNPNYTCIQRSTVVSRTGFEG